MLKERTWKPLGFAAAAFLLTLPLIALNDLPSRDAVFRYIPMTESFLSGEWDTAFHPRIPFLFPMLAAAFAAVFRCPAYPALQLTGAIFFALSFLPLRDIFRRVFDEKTADWGCAAALFSAGLLRLGAEAMREDLKLFFFLVCADALLSLFRNPRSLRSMLLLSASAALMSLTRDDSILIAALFALTAAVLEIRATRRFPWRFGCGILTGILLILPQLTVNCFMTGYPVMSCRFLPAAEKCLSARWFDPVRCSRLPRFAETVPEEGSVSLPSGKPEIPAAETDVKASPPAVPPPSPPSGQKKSRLQRTGDFFSSLLRGLIWPAALTALPAMYIRLKKKKWTSQESLLFGCWAGHAVLILTQIVLEGKFPYVSARYLLPAAPLICGWTALTLLFLYREAGKHVRAEILRPLSAGLLLLCAAGFWLEAAKPGILAGTSPAGKEKRHALFRMADAIRKDFQGPAKDSRKTFHTKEYRSFRQPGIATGDADFARLAYLTNGGPAEIPEADYIAEKIGTDAAIPASPPGYMLLLALPENTFTVLLWKKRNPPIP